MFAQRRRQLSQNFLTDQRLLRRIVSASSVSPDDTVVEIGPGKGLLTRALLRAANTVLAVELDDKLILHLRQQFAGEPRLDLRHGDFLDYPLPATPYKVFANTPFASSGRIVRKLLTAQRPPEDSYLVVQRELALRLSGQPHHNQFSLRYQPSFDFSIVHQFRRSDFTPPPRVESVLWRIMKRQEALLPADELARYHQFIEVAFAQGQPIGAGLRPLYPRQTLRRLLPALRLHPHLKPGYLTLQDWLALYRALPASHHRPEP